MFQFWTSSRIVLWEPEFSLILERGSREIRSNTMRNLSWTKSDHNGKLSLEENFYSPQNPYFPVWNGTCLQRKTFDSLRFGYRKVTLKLLKHLGYRICLALYSLRILRYNTQMGSGPHAETTAQSVNIISVVMTSILRKRASCRFVVVWLLWNIMCSIS